MIRLITSREVCGRLRHVEFWKLPLILNLREPLFCLTAKITTMMLKYTFLIAYNCDRQATRSQHYPFLSFVGLQVICELFVIFDTLTSSDNESQVHLFMILSLAVSSCTFYSLTTLAQFVRDKVLSVTVLTIGLQLASWSQPWCEWYHSSKDQALSLFWVNISFYMIKVWK